MISKPRYRSSCLINEPVGEAQCCECDTESRADRCATRSDRRVKYYFFAREREGRKGKTGVGVRSFEATTEGGDGVNSLRTSNRVNYAR